ncbi:ImcF-related family protein [Burkholderia sp. A2]|uniref:ImcF-related family protein n=1 Tax=Burkholderia sp. A2 TaxID=236253 RepID=UPI00084CC2DC|nr:ImcF-related family protein [Burkholderia sp. A2]OED14430.1 type VI secretion protein VasK [Burkholderia sp. A2]
MSISKNNLQHIERQVSAEKATPSRAAIWGLPLAALVLAVVALWLIWFYGDHLGIADGMHRMQIMTGIPVLLVAVVTTHLYSISTGAYASAARLFRLETGEMRTTSTRLKPPKRDARLQCLYEELRVAHGWFWRRRLCWLLVNGTDDRIDQVAPGLKQAGIMHVDETVLVHASPDGIESTKWLGQIRELRRRNPVDGLVQVACASDADPELPRTLSTIAIALGRAAPITFLHPVEAKGGNLPERFDPVGTFMPSSSRKEMQTAGAFLLDRLRDLEYKTADAGVRMGGQPHWYTWLLEISQYIGDQRERMIEGWQALAASKWLRVPLTGIMFVPVLPGASTVPVPIPEVADDVQDPSAPAIPVEAVTREQPVALLPVWRKIAAGVCHYRGRRTKLYWPNVLAGCALFGAIAWLVMLVMSGIGNRVLVREVQAVADVALTAPPGTPQALHAQLALQKQISLLEYRQLHGVPWYLRAGLSRNDELLDALWLPYRTIAARNLRQPVVQALEGQLTQLSQVRDDEQQSRDARARAYNRLKAYLMLAEPSRTDAPFLKTQLLDVWPAPAGMRAGEWLDISQQLAGFWATHLQAHPVWRIDASMPLVAQMRSTLVNQIGLAGSDDMLYQGILDAARGKYADASLATLLAGADAHGLFTTAQTVPGIYTRAAWDGMVAAAIDKASRERRVSGDWVLTGAQSAQTIGNVLSVGTIKTVAAIDEKRVAEELKQRLTARYFAEYAAAWQHMLNSIQWQPAANLNGAIDQLSRLADTQTSPLIALMKAVQDQAQAGRPSQALSDTLVRKAQSLIGSDEQLDARAVHPLDKPFGPLLALMGDVGAAPAGGNGEGNMPANIALNGVSLSRYLTAVTTMRLKLQQIAGSADAQAMARSLAQAVFQGKLSDLSQARDDAALTAASLGAAWSGFGSAAFAQPLEGAWQTILQPAAASLNGAWRSSVAMPFNAAMNGRYPFFDTNTDASFAELGRYVRPDTGLIARFVSTQLAGVLTMEGDHWVPDELAPQALQFDPKFLSGLRQLSTVGAQLYLQGDAGERFEMMALPTPNVTRSELSVDGKQIVYFNQRESWTPLAWPGNGLNGHAGLTWQTVGAGLRQAFDATGDWAFLRLLGKADVKPLDSTRYQLTWNAPHDEPLRYVLRAQVGAGPLDLLKLRGFRMPERIFVVGKGGSQPAFLPPPPLPPEMQP